jgi:cytochrome P450
MDSTRHSITDAWSQLFNLGLIPPWSPPALMLLILVSFLSVLIFQYSRLLLYSSRDLASRDAPFPPTPVARLITNHLRLPQYDSRLNRLLGQIFGPVTRVQYGYSANFLGMPSRTISSAHDVMLLNSSVPAVQLLERQSAEYSSRARSIAAGKYLSDNKRIVLQPYGSDWKRHHRALARLFSKEKINSVYRKAFEQESLVLVQGLASVINREVARECIPDLTSRYTASSVLQISYARRATSSQDQVLEDLAKVSENIAMAFTPGAFWVESLPFLDWFPAWMCPWKQKLKAAHDFEMGINGSLVTDVQRRLREHRSHGDSHTHEQGKIAVRECCTAQLLSAQDSLSISLDDIAYLSATVFEAGTETTAMTLNTFFLACITFPDFVAHAQAEIDAALSAADLQSKNQEVCFSGPATTAVLPSFEHMDQLPYVRAVIRETLRFTPTGSTGVAHTSTCATDDILDFRDGGDNGDNTTRPHHRYRISAGCTVLPNTYGIHHDAALYPDPYRFLPERFLPAGVATGQSPRIGARGQRGTSLDLTAGHHAFGFGRRICPGLDLASNALFISTARVLACLDMQPTAFAREKAEELREEDERWVREWRRKGPALFGRDAATVNRVLEGMIEERVGLPELAPLLDAYNTFRLSKEDLGRCLKINVRNPERVKAAEMLLAQI